ncbi:16S rRNA (uracil(1498)-N(3))-methyltransferase [Allocoleopsis sp.]|uniref:16S rRNA (uracil(1498)-N(3))-methyltransferase n=1 Tax=Allocoleopsis sp. TaxID=3088169 RepID=UPI002FD199E0
MVQLQRLVIAPQQHKEGEIFLTPSQQHYLSRVLRLKAGDRFIAMDGQGSWWVSELAADLTQANILESLCVETELSGTVTLMAAMPKGNGFDDVVYQATELGVACIIPLKSDRTLLNPSPQKLERWRRLTQEAAEQSERQIVPTLFDPIDFVASLELPETSNAYRYIAVARGDAPHLVSCLQNQILEPDAGQFSVMIATGPEGGWTGTEVEQAKTAGFQPVSLGDRILRAVTAPIVALSVIASVLELKANVRFPSQVTGVRE